MKVLYILGLVMLFGLAIYGGVQYAKASTMQEITITRTPNYCECGNWTQGEDGWWYRTLRCSNDMKEALPVSCAKMSTPTPVPTPTRSYAYNPDMPCWARIVQLDPDSPLIITNCDTSSAHYPAYMEDFWEYATRDITFMYGNNTVKVYGIAVGWEETRTTCETTTQRYQQDYHFGE